MDACRATSATRATAPPAAARRVEASRKLCARAAWVVCCTRRGRCLAARALSRASTDAAARLSPSQCLYKCVVDRVDAWLRTAVLEQVRYDPQSPKRPLTRPPSPDVPYSGGERRAAAHAQAPAAAVEQTAPEEAAPHELAAGAAANFTPVERAQLRLQQAEAATAAAAAAVCEAESAEVSIRTAGRTRVQAARAMLQTAEEAVAAEGAAAAEGMAAARAAAAAAAAVSARAADSLAIAVAAEAAAAEKQRAEAAARAGAVAEAAKRGVLPAAAFEPAGDGVACVAPIVVGADYVARCTGGFADSRLIGKGGFGSVFRAVDASLGRRFAVKRIEAPGGAAAPGARSAAREVALLTRFAGHPHVIRLLGYTAPGAPGPVCVLYELAERGGLDGYLQPPPGEGALVKAAELSWPRRLRVATGVASALSFLHRPDGAGGKAFHRDVKAANVVLLADWTPKLADCGLAKLFSEAELAARPAGGTVAAAGYGQAFGTQGCRCPEYSETNEYSERSEVFSFGVLLLELLTGRLSEVTPTRKGNLAGVFFSRGTEALAEARDARLAPSPWPEPVAAALEELAARCCGRWGQRPRMADAKRGLDRCEAVHGVEKRLLQSTIDELVGRADAAAAAADARLRTCAVCCADGCPLEAGLECAGHVPTAPHFTCWSCLSAAAAAAAERTAAAGARCCAAGADCDAPPWTEVQLARGLSAEALAALRAAQLQAQRIALSAEHAAEVAELRTRLAEAEARSGHVQTLRLHVINTILTPSCPRCRRAFAGFTGCFALECKGDTFYGPGAAAAAAAARNEALRFCGAAFCAWCFHLCGADAHSHVARCQYNLNGHSVHGGAGGEELYATATRRREARALDAYFATLEPQLRAALSAAMRDEIAERAAR